MRTVGIILKEARQAKGYTLAQVERETKIRIKFLEAIEADDYTKLPSQAYAKGFVKNYSDYLGLNSHNVLAFFRRQTKEVPRSSLLPKGVSEPLNRTWFQLTPGKFLALILAGLGIIFLSYLGLQYNRLSQSPALTVTQPKDNLVVSEARLDVFGKTDPDATVTVNNISVLVRSDGQFFDQLTLDPGVNKITITATSRYGKVTTINKDVAYQAR